MRKKNTGFDWKYGICPPYIAAGTDVPEFHSRVLRMVYELGYQMKSTTLETFLRFNCFILFLCIKIPYTFRTY